MCLYLPGKKDAVLVYSGGGKNEHVVVWAGRCLCEEEGPRGKTGERNLSMDVAQQAVGTNVVKDTVGERCQKLFQDFLEE